MNTAIDTTQRKQNRIYCKGGRRMNNWRNTWESECAYNFCKSGVSTQGPPCVCRNGHTQPCCKGDKN